MELWNRKDVQVPPNYSVKMRSSVIDIMHLKSIFNDAVKMLEGKHVLHREAALLSRYLYKAQLKMRGHKGLMFLDKVNRGLKRYVSLDLEYVYQNFSMMLVFDGCEEWVYVPTKQMLQYVLIRTLGFSKLMSYLSTACQNAALYHKGVLALGHLINQNLVCLGIISRIWYCTRYFMICACQWYTQLLPFLEKLQINGAYLLPTEFEFPLDLKTWLESDPLSELKYEADVQKITQDISAKFKDIGKPVDRKEFSAQKRKTMNIPSPNKSMGFTTRNGELLTTPVHAVLKTPTVKPTIDELFDFKSLQEDLGEPLSRDHLVLQKTSSESIPITSNEFTNDGAKLLETVDFTPKSNNLKLFMKTTRDLCSNSYKDSTNDLRELIRDDQSFEVRENNSFATSKLANNAKNSKKCNTVSKSASYPSSEVEELTIVEHSKKALRKMKSNKGVPNDVQDIHLFSKSRSSKAAVTVTSLSDDANMLPCEKNNAPLHIDSSRKNDISIQRNNMQKLSNKSQAQNDKMQNQSGNIVKTLPTSKDRQKSNMVSKFDSKVSDVLEDQGLCVIAAKPLLRKKKKSLDKWEIINEIRTINNVKEFLRSEKKARAKEKHCVTSELNCTEWTVLVDAINKFLKKCSITKPKGNKKVKSVIGEIRNTLISFII